MGPRDGLPFDVVLEAVGCPGAEISRNMKGQCALTGPLAFRQLSRVAGAQLGPRLVATDERKGGDLGTAPLATSTGSPSGPIRPRPARRAVTAEPRSLLANRA